MSETKKIDAYSKVIRKLLANEKYAIDVYQREYKWQREHIATLIEDLESKFLNSFDADKGREFIQTYPHYFLGSFVLSVKDNKKFIIDGQQRLTSITLLLIFIRNLAKKENIEITKIDDLIYSEKYGVKSYNINVPERMDAMEKLFKSQQNDSNISETDESIRNIYERYDDIAELFPESLKGENGKILPYFVDWLIDNVDMVEITAYSDDDAYTIFETMNDRGLNLTQTDMLKGYLLVNIKENQQKHKANNLWKKQISRLNDFDKTADDIFLKSWIRAKYAETIREGKKGATNKDFEKIGNAFHKWIRDEKEKLGLRSSEGFFDFIDKKFLFFSNLYMKLWNAELSFVKDLDIVFYNNYHSFTYQDILILSAVKLEDDPDAVLKKMRLISRFVEMFIVLRSINYRTLGSSAIRYTMFMLMKDIRETSIDDLTQILKSRISEMEETFNGLADFGMHQQNKYFIKFFLSRITQYIEEKSGINTTVENYMNSKIKKPFEIEHILANKFERYKNEFNSGEEFDGYRNSIGALVLLQRGYNQSFNDDEYKDKVKYYLSHSKNLLARSLHPQCYEKDPSFLQYKKDSGLQFKSYDTFGKKEIKERCELLKGICQQVWDMSEFDKIIKS